MAKSSEQSAQATEKDHLLDVHKATAPHGDLAKTAYAWNELFECCCSMLFGPEKPGAENPKEKGACVTEQPRAVK